MFQSMLIALAGLASLSPIMAAPASTCDVIYYDSNSTSIKYHGPVVTPDGPWAEVYETPGHGPKLRNGNEAYSTAVGASYTVFSPITTGTFTIYSPKASNRGLFTVFVNGEDIGTGDEYDGACNAECIYDEDCNSDCDSVVVFSSSMPTVSDTFGINITVQAFSADTRFSSFPVLALNQIVFEPEMC